MRLLIKNALIYNTAERAFERGDVMCADGRIVALEAGNEYDEVIDAQGAYLVPGLVDIHTHGRAGFDFSDADEVALRHMSESYLKLGVTTVIPTLASDTFPGWLASIERINAVKRDAMCVFDGLHLEGRYLNPAKRGVQSPKLLVAPDTEELGAVLEASGLPLHVSHAPEMDKDGAFAAYATQHGVTLSAGHTAATYDEAKLGEARGVRSYTHLFNTMNPLHHREGGTVCAALEGDAYAELICDGMHISRGVVRLAYKCKRSERLVLVSDSMAGAGMPDGEYVIAGVKVYVRSGKALDADGALGGSTLDMLGALKNLMSFCEITLEEALPCATINPARVVGLDGEIGSIEVGKRADMLLLSADGELDLMAVIKGGTYAEL